MKTFTVFGIYQDNWQRHCEFVEADSSDHAERTYRKEFPDCLVSAVCEGRIQPSDTFCNSRAMDDHV